MRWFVVFLLLANLVLFFWMKQAALPPGTAEIPPPEVGRLRLLTETAPSEDDAKPVDDQDAASPALSPPDPANEVGLREPTPQTSAAVVPPNGDRTGSLDAQIVETGSGGVSAAELESGSSAESGNIAAGDTVDGGTAADVDEAGAEEPGLDGGSTVPAPPRDVTPNSPAPQPTVAPPIRTAPRVCARIGPLQPADADALVAGLPPPVELVSDIVEETEAADGYYVLVPPLPDRATGQRILKQLGDAGFSDTWLFRKGPFENAISLGLFSRRSSAQRHADAVAAKGFDIEVHPRTATEEVRWVTVSHLGEGNVREALSLPEDVGISELACPE
jgi:hypothetical protein